MPGSEQQQGRTHRTTAGRTGDQLLQQRPQPQGLARQQQRPQAPGEQRGHQVVADGVAHRLGRQQRQHRRDSEIGRVAHHGTHLLHRLRQPAAQQQQAPRHRQQGKQRHQGGAAVQTTAQQQPHQTERDPPLHQRRSQPLRQPRPAAAKGEAEQQRRHQLQQEGQGATGRGPPGWPRQPISPAQRAVRACAPVRPTPHSRPS